MQAYINKLYQPIVKDLGWTPKGTQMGTPPATFARIYKSIVVRSAGRG
jgi:hypothetical protein